jgi:hypothetical protein
MSAPIGVNTKKRGRPVTTGKGHLVGVRLLAPALAALDAWITHQPEPRLSRPEAIRRILAAAAAAPSSSDKVAALQAENAHLEAPEAERPRHR